MYRFQIRAQTKPGDSIGLVGALPELGQWDASRALRLSTHADCYPLWWADLDLKHLAGSQAPGSRLQYKYVRFGPNGQIEWEAWGWNRWIPLNEAADPEILIVEDGTLGSIPPWPYGYPLKSGKQKLLEPGPQGLKVVVIGSSVALGCSAWQLKGWAELLKEALHETYGHQVVNVSHIGANVSTTIDRFPVFVAPENPDIVIIALSLGNEGLAHCQPHQRPAVQRRFESGLKQLIKMIRELGAQPILGGLYPHGDYEAEHYRLLQETHRRMLSWGVPVLDWLACLDDGTGRWQPGISFDAAHPNTGGHHLMFEAIDLGLFAPEQVALTHRIPHGQEIPVYRDDWGFHVFTSVVEHHLRIINTTGNSYTIAPYWHELQTALQAQAKLQPGLYIADKTAPGTPSYFAVQVDGTISTTIEISPGADLEYQSAFHLFSPQNCLFYNGDLAILKENDQQLRVINESDHVYNIHPMWKEVRSALQKMSPGVYEDPDHPDLPFRTMMIGPDGLESRVKAPPQSTIVFRYQCALSDISRIAILPLGDRCAVRMLLYKLEYDGPAFPFDLTRTTKLSDVADIIASGFSDMWNPDLLHYNPEERRIYHAKWSGLSFAHEVEETDHPDQDMSPVWERMQVRYSARSNRFWYTLNHCDKVLFIRTGGTDRSSVIDLMHKLETKCQGKPFRLLLISQQPSAEFAGLTNVLHYDRQFNPDLMYEDLGHWMHCTEIMHNILESLGISSKNLFWCPPNPPEVNPGG